MYSQSLYEKRLALPVDSVVPVYLARVYRNKLITLSLDCKIVLSKWQQKMLKSLDPVPPSFKRYFKAYSYYDENQDPCCYLGLGYSDELSAIKSLYEDDLLKFKKHYDKFQKTKTIISATHPHLFK